MRGHLLGSRIQEQFASFPHPLSALRPHLLSSHVPSRLLLRPGCSRDQKCFNRHLSVLQILSSVNLILQLNHSPIQEYTLLMPPVYPPYVHQNLFYSCLHLFLDCTGSGIAHHPPVQFPDPSYGGRGPDLILGPVLAELFNPKHHHTDLHHRHHSF